MKVYTKTGDKGTTGLLTGERIAKDSIRVETYGTIDEINSALGLARALSAKPETKETIYKLQKFLMLFMAELASSDGSRYVPAEQVKLLEQTIDVFYEKLPPLKEFVVPGDNAGAAALDLARTVARRAERQLVRLSRQEKVNEDLLISLNRLSDLCFVLSRYESLTE